MTQAMQQRQTQAQSIEEVLLSGNLKNLSPAERVVYHDRVCQSLGLNPLTRPFDYLELNGKVVLYARRDATDQLRKIHAIDIVEITRERTDDLYIVTVSAVDKTGRRDSATGAVAVGGLRGEALANALMKAETKAKRRVTLSICGLGMLDESETDWDDEPRPAVSMPRRLSERSSAPPGNVDAATGEILDGPLWTKKELDDALRSSALTVRDLSPVLGGEATRENYAELIDGWMCDHPGKRVADLIAAAIDHHTKPPGEPQPALIGDN
jgi:hypothetical protein